MPRPKNYAFEKAQRERARQARKAARKNAKADKPEGEAGESETAPTVAEAPGVSPDKDPSLG